MFRLYPFIKLTGFVLALFSAGCSTTEKVMDSWRGHHIEEVVVNWGAPSSSLKLTDGRSIYSWVSNWGSAYLLNTCRQSFTTDQNNIIQNWRFTGCPQWQTLSVKDISKLFPQKK